VVEIAAVPLVEIDALVRHTVADDERGASSWQVCAGASSLVAPGRRVPPEARAVHHLSDGELRNAPHLPRAMADVLMAVDRRGERIEALCAHNADFDRGFLGGFFPSDVPWLDTWRLAMHLWPDAPGYGNGVLFYWLGIDRTMPVTEAQTHRALYDATVTAHLLQQMLRDSLLADLLVLQGKPVLQRTCRFGKHRGVAWSDVPRDYLGWVLRQENPPFDDDVRYTAGHWLGY
jgi:exodeoxyribonuclease X